MTDRNGIIVLRIIAVVIALALWAFVSMEHRSERPAERVVDASVTYNTPAGMILLNPVDKVRVRLRGSGRIIQGINPYVVDVQVELPAGVSGPIEVALTSEQVLRPDGLEVISIEPRSLELQLDRELRRLLPVRVRVSGEPAAGAIAGQPSVRPEQVLVTGPGALVDDLDYVETSPIRLDGHALDFEETALVVSPDALVKVQSPVVQVTIPMRQPQPAGEAIRGPKR